MFPFSSHAPTQQSVALGNPWAKMDLRTTASNGLCDGASQLRCFLLLLSPLEELRHLRVFIYANVIKKNQE